MPKKIQNSIAPSAANPFSDSQARNYSDRRVVTEFCPVSNFWSLFNDQHEILIGTRGCGKTILLKMMRYSMLNKLNDSQAKKIIKDKNYISFYVPLHLEYIKKISDSSRSVDAKVAWFRFAFNCALAQSLIIEISELLKDLYPDELARIKIEYELVKSIDQCWMIDSSSSVFQFKDLRDKVNKLFYRINPASEDLSVVPSTFTHSLGSTLSSISDIVCEKLNISPTWIVCIDEAEFLDECYQRCINTAFRSDSNRIAFKMATLPFYHATKNTLDERIDVMDGQDFKYTLVDMKYDSIDFISLTNSLVKSRFHSEECNFERLEDFVETIGNDNYIDYYASEFGKKLPEVIENEIWNQLSESSKRHNSGKAKSQIKKPIIDKLAPIFYLREVYKRKKGRYTPGWYAGASMVRRVAQGNPRIFIRIMNELYNGAKGSSLPLSLKKQSKIILNFSDSFCNETQTLERSGPEAKRHLEYIAQTLHAHTHDSKLVQSGVSFRLADNTNLLKHKLWIEKSIAFSRLIVDDNSLKTQITNETVFHMAHIFAVKYWLPMRTHASPIKLILQENMEPTYIVSKPNRSNKKKTNVQVNGEQISLKLGDIIQ